MEAGQDISGLGSILNSQRAVCTGVHAVRAQSHGRYRYAPVFEVEARIPNSRQQYAHHLYERVAAACKLRRAYRNSGDRTAREQALQELKKSRLGRAFSYI